MFRTVSRPLALQVNVCRYNSTGAPPPNINPFGSFPSSSTPRNDDPDDFDGPPTLPADRRPAQWGESGAGLSGTLGEPRRLEDKEYSARAHRLYCQATRNNTMITITDPKGNPIKGGIVSAGKLKFKNVGKSTFEAGYQCAVYAFQRLYQQFQTEPGSIAIHIKGFGEGREALKSALLAGDGDFIRSRVVEISDRTSIKIGGTRSKKKRRL